jgi:glycosyltransferase involved in cell wall biosynthesis
MHILVTADTIGGVWNYTRELVTGLARRGVRVTLVSFGGVPMKEQRAWLEGLHGVQYLPTAYGLEWMQDAERDLRESVQYLGEVIRDARPDLLHLSQFCYGAMKTTQPRIVVAHSDVLSWNQAVHGELPKGPWAKWYGGMVRKGLAGANLVVAPSQWMLQSLEDCYGRQPKSRVIYNGRTPARFDPMARKENYAVGAGRLWDEGKQLRLLMEMERPPLPIRVAGAKALAGESARGEAKSVPGVEFVGELSEEAMRELLSRAAIYIAASKYEPFGLAPLEAALSRCAIVANDIPSLREVWEDTVLYFRKDDARSLREALVLLHGDRELRMEYANRAYERAVRHYMAGRMVDEYMEAYASLLEPRVRAA